MFKYLKKKFSIALDLPALIEKMGSILKLDNVAEKTEQLLSLKETLKNNRGRAEGNLALLISAAGIALLTGAVLIPVSVVAAAVLITPGLITMGASLIATISISRDSAKTTTMVDKINKEVAALIDSHPQEVIHSPKLQQSIKEGFNHAANVESDFAKLTVDVAQKKAAALSKG